MFEIKNFSKAYKKNEYVIKDLNLTLPNTGLVVLYGKSGCGKTTLLNALGGMDFNYEGEIYYDNTLLPKEESKISSYRRLVSSFVFQGGLLLDNLTVEDNLKFVLELENREVDFEPILTSLNLKGFKNRKIKHLSGGERQRIAIARALVKNSNILFLDEPTSALDRKNGIKVFELLKMYAKDRLIVVVTHDTKKASLFADRMIKLVDGNISDDKIINSQSDIEKTYSLDKPNKKYLKRVISYFLTNGFLINLFISLFLIFTLVLLSVGKEAQNVKKNYSLASLNKPTNFEYKRTLLTQKQNNVHLFYVNRLRAGDAKEVGFNTFRDESDVFSKAEIDKLKMLLPKNMYMLGNSLYGNITSEDPRFYGKLIIDDIGPHNLTHFYNVNTEDPDDPGAEKRTFIERRRSSYPYFLYNENYDYNLVRGRKPEKDDEILVTDVIASVYYANKTGDIFFDYDYILFKEDKQNYLTIRDIYHKDGDYRHTIEKKFKVVGIIETKATEHFEYYDKNARVFSLLKEHIYIRNGKFMNPVYTQPFGYIVLKQHLQAMYDYKHEEIGYKLPELFIEGLKLSGKINAFCGSNDKRLIEPIYDDLELDTFGRIIIKDDLKTLQAGEVLISIGVLEKIYNRTFTESEIINLKSEIINKKIKIKAGALFKSEEKTFLIKGITRTVEEIFFSSKDFSDLVNLDRAPLQESIILNLEKFSVNKRMKLITKLNSNGFFIRAVESVPSSYLEWVENRGFQEVIDDEGFKEYLNISPYYLYSKHYTNKTITSLNETLDILSSMSVFIVVLCFIIFSGFLFLKEQTSQKTVNAMNKIGVKAKIILRVNIFIYLAMGLIIFISAFLLTYGFSFLVNNLSKVDVSLKTYIDGEFIQLGNPIYVYRVRMLVTKSSVLISLVGSIIFVLIGIFSSFISIRKGIK